MYIVVFISDKVSNVCSKPVFLCHTIGIFKLDFVEKIVFATVCRQVYKVEEVV